MHAIQSNFANNPSNDQMPQLWTSLVLYDVYAHVRLHACMHMHVCATTIHNNTNINIHTTHTFCLVPTSSELTPMGRTVCMRADDIIHDCDITVAYHTDTDALAWDMVQRSWRIQHERCGKLNDAWWPFWQCPEGHDARMKMGS